jgi:hypothetical protein
MAWETTIRTGTYASDQQALADCDARARAEGLVLKTTPLPGGGFHVAAVPAYGSAPPPAYPPPQQPQYPPHVQNPYAPAPAQFSAAPSPYGNPYAAPAGGFGAGYGGAPQQATASYGKHPHGNCQTCGVAGPVKHSTFMQNIGMLVIRFPSTRSGHMCRRCTDQFFWQYTLVTGFFGWWGMISFVYSLISIPTNIINYIGALGMPEPPPDAYARAGVPYSAWPGWRIAVLLLGGLGVLCTLLWTAAMALAAADAARDNDLDGAGLIGMIVFTIILWLFPIGMILAAVKRPKVAGLPA